MEIVNDLYVITSEPELTKDWWHECQAKNRVFVAVHMKKNCKYAEVHYDTFTKELYASDALNVDGFDFVLHIARYYKADSHFSENFGFFKKLTMDDAIKMAQDLSTIFLLSSVFTSAKTSYDPVDQSRYDADGVKNYLERTEFVKSYIGA